jgi:DNA-binding transcriptional LysR family regulator
MGNMMDRFHELKAFIAVVEAGGFSAAARRTGDSQPAVSKAIGETARRGAV